MLYRDFKDTGDFTKLVREHLDGLIIDEWRGDRWAQVLPPVRRDESGPSSLPLPSPAPISDRPLDITDTEHEEDELGVLEYVAAFQEASNAIVMAFQSSVSRVPALTGRFKRSRKRAAAILGELVAEMSFSIQEAKALLEEMGGEPTDSSA